MTYSERDRELQELLEAGLDAPIDTDSLSIEELDDLAAKKQASAKRDEGVVSLLTERVREASNYDPPQTSLTVTELRERADRDKRRTDELERRTQLKLKQQREAKIKQWQVQVAPVWRNATVSDLPSNLKDASLDWLAKPDEEKQALILLGPTGVGKTWMMYAVMRELFINGLDCEVLDIGTLLDEMRPGDDSAKRFEWFRRVGALGIDDLGVEKRTEWANERLYMIFDHRWQWCLPTIVTSNADAAGFKELMGDRLASRLFGPGTTVRVTGKDLRIHADHRPQN